MNNRGPAPLSLFVVTAPGIAEITAREIGALGLHADRVEPAGVSLSGSQHELYRLNLWLRTASRVLVRLGSFHARTFAELERHASKIDWAPYAGKGAPFRVRATARKSKLYHSAAIEQRMAKAVSAATGAVPDADSSEEEGDETGQSQLFLARVERDEFTISVDSSGDLLHRRGYRQAVAKAPLRETLAAAALLASGWTPDEPLVDPFCGSGTISIEGALLARGLAPGAQRSFAFERWAGFEERSWAQIRADARNNGKTSAVAIRGSDRDAGAIRAATENAARAGVGGDVVFEEKAVSQVTAPPGRGWIVTNPPYGVRLSPDAAIRNLYARLGAVARDRFAGWGLGFLSADRALDAQLGLSLEEKLSTNNGGIPIRLMTARISA